MPSTRCTPGQSQLRTRTGSAASPSGWPEARAFRSLCLRLGTHRLPRRLRLHLTPTTAISTTSSPTRMGFTSSSPVKATASTLSPHLDPTIASKRLTSRFSRLLVDGSNNINFLYHNTLLKLGLRDKDLQLTRTVFHGIVLGQSCSPIGKIRLDVLFGDKAHFLREPVWFEVVDLHNPYHMLLGRLALGKFMATPQYAYLKMKMSGPKGIITISGDYKKSM
ncbi:hypothetical protein ZWY2020_033304 [Hordeum vulgare]|nr:hypothetical protein ZWY2020_033304 [Hordeum vulgare]